MQIGCEFWRPARQNHWGRCQAGRYGGRPSIAVCLRQCDRGPRLPATVRSLPRPGSLLAGIIHHTTGERPCGACLDLAAEMDRHGWWWSWTHRDDIIDRLVEEAAKRGHQVPKATIAGLLRAAFHEMRRRPRPATPV